MFDVSKPRRIRRGSSPWVSRCVTTVAKQLAEGRDRVTHEDFLRCCVAAVPVKPSGRDTRRQTLARAIRTMVEQGTFPLRVEGSYFILNERSVDDGLDLI